MSDNGIPETAMKVCLLSAYQANMFRNNTEVKNTDYNIIPALKIDDLGQNGYGEVASFIKTNLVPQKQVNKGPNVYDGTERKGARNDIEYVYVVAFNYMSAGFKAPWYPTISGKQNDKQIPYVTMSMRGCYGVTRIQDPAVICIECVGSTVGKIPFTIKD